MGWDVNYIVQLYIQLSNCYAAGPDVHEPVYCSKLASVTHPNAATQGEQWAEATSLMSRLSAQLICIIWYGKMKARIEPHAHHTRGMIERRKGCNNPPLHRSHTARRSLWTPTKAPAVTTSAASMSRLPGGRALPSLHILIVVLIIKLTRGIRTAVTGIFLYLCAGAASLSPCAGIHVAQYAIFQLRRTIFFL